MNFKIIVHSMPGSGHVNPISVVVERLVKEYNCHCIWYCLDEYKAAIEKSGAEFRALIHTSFDFKLPANKRTPPVGKLVSNFIQLNRDNAINIAREIDIEQPDLLLIDSMAYHAKWALRYYETNYKRANKLRVRNKKNHIIPSAPLPPVVFFDTSFATEKKLFPTKVEEKIMFNLPKIEKIKMFISVLRVIPKVKRLAKEHDIEYVFPMKEIFEVPPRIKRIVAIFPSFQARYHLLPKNIKFIGSCIDEKVRIFDVNESLQRVLDKYQPVNPIEPCKREVKNQALIYISLGTVFNNNLPLYTKIIDALLLLREKSLLNNLKFEDLNFIISAGNNFDGLLNKYTELPSNILVLRSVPQLEILKRASLFVTHCGMNSINESIYYGVPIVGIPITADQPLVANRASTELGIGVNIDFINLKPAELMDAITVILNDEGYSERAHKLSKESREHNGKENGANEIIQFIKSQKIENSV